MWNNESKEVREIYTALSNLAEKKHIEKYGKDYKYKPDPLKKTNKNQKKEPKTPRKKKVQTCETGHFMINFIDFSTPTTSPNTNETITHRPPHPPHPPNIDNFQTATFNFPQIELNNNKPNEFIWQEHFMLNQFPLIDDIDDMNEEVDSVYELFSEKSPKQYIYYDL
ncbi:hypothetical protein C1645_763456 [Glomus cerebriforme]|uniref:HMG box domain-containing protein n=1 Tax=Glomus cerebriforme TaxID=658196 RepID=A0A397T7W9_9GLOM|nr:hypothetical protein C1645_763456 [Glomus cerebriforme]